MQGVAREIKKPNFEKKICQFGLAVMPAIEKYSINIKKNTFMGENLYYVDEYF